MSLARSEFGSKSRLRALLVVVCLVIACACAVHGCHPQPPSPSGPPTVVGSWVSTTRTVLVTVWHVRVGRVTLYLLDTDLEENAPWDRELSARLYGGDRETRVQQEIILGIGGVRVLKAMGVHPSVYHLNEGHAAFVAVQRIRDLCEAGASFDAALDEVRRTTVFTTIGGSILITALLVPVVGSTWPAAWASGPSCPQPVIRP